jgi:cell division septation protein DedD
MKLPLMVRGGVMLALCAGVAAGEMHAQSAPAASGAPSAAVNRVVGRARGLIESGSGADARTLLDSLVATLSPTSDDLAEALYWRATLAERATDAERDWKRLAIEAPLHPRTADALVRLGEFELLRGRPAAARPYFDRVTKDFPDTPQRAKSTLWVTRSYFDERKAPEACTALATLPAARVPEGELRLQYDELGRRCAGVRLSVGAPAVSANAASPSSRTDIKVDSKTDSKTDTRPTSSAPSEARTGKYSVQLAAYDTEEEANATVKRLRARGIEARVDGDAKPYRVRSGRFQTRAEANKALAALKKQGQSGFIAELRP